MPEPSDVAVDRWIHCELKRAYDGVLDEELPEQFLRLIDTLAVA